MWGDALTRGELPPRAKMMQEFGVKFTHEDTWEGTPGVDRKRFVLLDTVRGVEPGFTPEQWCALCQRDGVAYVGGCCGNMSYLQDIMNMVFRNGYIEKDEMVEIARIAQGHEGFDQFDVMDDEAFKAEVVKLRAASIAVSKGSGSIIDPWVVLGLAYNAFPDEAGTEEVEREPEA